MTYPKPDVSVICTTYNAEDTISSVIDSLMLQSEVSFEIVLVDDGSTDTTPALLKKKSAFDNRMKLFISTHIGRPAALNLGLSKSSGDYIAIIDADDPSHPERLTLQKSMLRESNFALIGSDVIYLSGDEEPGWEVIESCDIHDVTGKLTYFNPLPHSSVMYKRSWIVDVGGYREDLESQVDWDIYIRIAAKGGRLGCMSQKLASKRIHRGQSFENKNRLRYLKNAQAMQLSAIRRLRGGWRSYLYFIMRGCWGVLPQKIRILKLKLAR